jgi:spermidine synthase
MTREETPNLELRQPSEQPLSPVSLLGLLLLSLGSGCAALICEIVWFQVLELVIGSSAVSLGLLLGTFMGGMCLGSLVAARWHPSRPGPLPLWALLQIGLGLLAVGILVGLPFAAQTYAAHASAGLTGLAFRAALSAAFLLPPTVLMGATLPVLSRSLAPASNRSAGLGLLYASNTVGAVAGCVVAGFYLLPNHDTVVASLVAATLNGSVAVLALALHRSASRLEHGSSSPLPTVPATPIQRLVLITIALSGLCAVAAEVIWTRLLSLILGATVYTFSIVLAVYLAGLGIGSMIGALLARRTRAPAIALGICQVLVAASVAWAAYVLCRSLPYWPINPSLSRSPWISFQIDLLRCSWAIMPATCLWGASFPLALAAAATAGEDPGRLVGRIYAANTAGAIVGALACSLVFIGWIGTQQTQRLLVGLSALAACVMFVRGEAFAGRSASPLAVVARPNRLTQLVVWPAVLALAAALAWIVPRLPWGLVAYGRNLPQKTELGLRLYLGEGLNASVAVSEAPTGQRLFHVSGKVEASTDPQDMRLQQMLGHLPALAHPDPKSVLVVGCGAGVTAGSFVLHPGVERVVICEIEPLIPAQVVPYFEAQNHQVLQDPRVSVVYDDARHYILRSRERFDIITSDPIHPWVKGAATLYTREYFELCKKHLNPGGFVTQWVPLYETSLEAVKTEIATFFHVFPNGTVWSNDELSGGGYDLVLLGQSQPLAIDLDDLQRRWHRADHAPVAQALSEVGISSAFNLLTTYAGQAPDLAPWLLGAQINSDRNLRLQYLAAAGANSSDPSGIYAELLRYRTFPEGLIIASSVWNRALHQNLEPNRSHE